LNVDYKIASKVLAGRLCKIIPNLIHSYQCGFVKGRYIGESVRTISDIMDYTKYNDIPGILLFLDFEKAFDSLEWDFLFKALNRMNFGPDFVNFVKAMYTNVSSCVMNNGLSSKYFTMGRGVRQGDPLSPYLFIIAIELLSCKIRESQDISGILINNSEIKIVQYADDTTCILKDENSVTNFLTSLKLLQMCLV
jgi:mannosylglycoprotein endo-beta-mannosidase